MLTEEITKTEKVDSLEKIIEELTEKEEKKEKKRFQKNRSLLDFFSLYLNHIKAAIDDQGNKTFFSVNEKNIAKIETKESILNLITKKIIVDHNQNYKFSDITDTYKTWSQIQTHTTLPPSFSIDPNEVTFNRINVSLNEGPTPTWDYFIKKCGSNGEAVMAFIWSILEKTDKSQQYLLLKGPGRDGKGSFSRWENRLLNDQLVGLDANNDRWAAQCVGKRVGIFNDLNNTSIILSSNFKQITGNEKITINQKYEKAFSTILDTKFILTTNKDISIINSDAERRRVILVELSEDHTVIEDYEEKLWQETSAFLYKCKLAYEKLYNKSTKQITCSYEAFEREASSFEEGNQALFDKCFELDSDSLITASIFFERITKALGERNDNKISNFKSWLERTHQIKRKQRLVDGKITWVYLGIKLKPIDLF